MMELIVAGLLFVIITAMGLGLIGAGFMLFEEGFFGVMFGLCLASVGVLVLILAAGFANQMYTEGVDSLFVSEKQIKQVIENEN